MKKLIFTIASLISLQAIAQVSTVDPRHPLFPDNEVKFIKPKSNQMGKTDVEAWYSPGAWVTVDATIGSGIKSYADFMCHDSTAKSVLVSSTGTETTVNAFGYIGIAQVLDPKDDVIDVTTDPQSKLTKFVGYQLDSIHFIYRYVRNVDSISDGVGGMLPVVDTLFIHYFKGTQITKSGLTFNGPPSRTVRYASMGWTGGNVRLPSNAFDVDTILLTKDDSTSALNANGGFENSWNADEMTLAAPAGMTVAPNQDNNLVAFALTFKSAIPTVIGTDTAVMIYQKDPSTMTPGTRRTNYFGYSLLVNESPNDWANPTFYNSALFVDAISAYSPWVVNSTVSFNGFIPGMIYNSERFINVDFFLKTNTNNMGISELRNNEFAMSNVYPNPAIASEKAVVAFNLAKKSTVNVSIINLVGQEVKAGFSKSFESGAHAEFLDLSGLKAGVYFVNMTVNGSSISKKLTVTE